MCIALAIPKTLAAPTAIAVASGTGVDTLAVASVTQLPSFVSQNSASNVTYTIPSPSAAGASQRKRHRKRHSIGSYDYNDLNAMSTTLEWENPCGGYYDPTAVLDRRPRRRNPRKIYKDLKVAAGYEFKVINDSRNDIDIHNFHMWTLYENMYKFLPKLKKNSSIALKRWYRNMQTYVASFAYLRRVQLKWDHYKSQLESDVAIELRSLLTSSRSMLCELETAVNKTHPYRRQARQLPHVTREQMNKRLKFRTRKRMQQNPNTLQEADSIDLKFVKYYYNEFVEHMWKVLRMYTKRKGQIAVRNNRKEFNEVDKDIGSRAAAVTSSSSSSSGGHKRKQKQQLQKT